MQYIIRPQEPGDDLQAITDLLHRAYGALAAKGMHYVASHQSPEVTAARLKKGVGLVAEDAEGTLVGTITLYGPEQTSGCAWYDRDDVAHFGQFGVEPAMQGQGLGEAMVRRVEELAREQGWPHLALDTSEHAERLIAWYLRLGYEKVGEADWRPEVNYRSVILIKVL